jgi:hypothetical protein
MLAYDYQSGWHEWHVQDRHSYMLSCMVHPDKADNGLLPHRYLSFSPSAYHLPDNGSLVVLNYPMVSSLLLALGFYLILIIL